MSCFCKSLEQLNKVEVINMLSAVGDASERVKAIIHLWTKYDKLSKGDKKFLDQVMVEMADKVDKAQS